MTDFSTIFMELAHAIERHGRELEISDPVRAVIDRYNMFEVARSDGAYLEIDFGLRRGGERISGHFFMTPATGQRPAHVAYDVDWHCGAAAPGLSGVERRSWNWDIDIPDGPGDDVLDLVFPILQ